MLLLLVPYQTFILLDFSVFNQLCFTFRPCILMLDSQSEQVSDSMDVFQNIRRLVLLYIGTHFYVNTAHILNYLVLSMHDFLLWNTMEDIAMVTRD